MLSVVTPAFNEAINLPVLYGRLSAVLTGLEWEWILIDDHSSDETFPAICALHRDDPRVSGFRLARTPVRMPPSLADWIGPVERQP